MSITPQELKYSKSHEWVQLSEDGVATVGITDHAQELLGDLVYVDLPELDADVASEQPCAVVESVKAASDVYSPVTGVIVSVNESLADTPELINQDAFGEGWIMKVKLSDPAEADKLMSADDYAAFADSESH